MDVRKLVKMANQIAMNFDYGPEKDKAIAGAVDHMRRFWTPDMRAAIIAYAESRDNDLTELASAVIAELGREAAGAA